MPVARPKARHRPIRWLTVVSCCRIFGTRLRSNSAAPRLRVVSSSHRRRLIYVRRRAFIVDMGNPSSRSIATLSQPEVGFDRVKTLRAEGKTVAEIARDLA
jgi:hypothetical protein